MANDYYTHGTVPQNSSNVRSYPMRNEFDLITLGFAKFPALTLANANKPLIVNSTGDGVTYTIGTLSLEGDFATTGAFNTTFVQQATTTQTLPSSNGGLTIRTQNPLRGTIWGLIMSNGADATNDITISPGACMSIDATDTNLDTMILTSSITKRIDANWVAGNNQGGFPSNLTLGNQTYAVFLVKTSSGVVDAGFDTSATGTNLLAIASITRVRRIGLVVRRSAVLVPFYQVGNKFFLTNFALGGVGNTFSTTNDTPFANITILPQNLTSINIIYMIKITVKDSTPGATVYLRFRYAATNNVASETNAQVAVGTGSTRSRVVILYSPWNGSLFSGNQMARRISTFTGSENTGVIMPFGWIDYRQP